GPGAGGDGGAERGGEVERDTAVDGLEGEVAAPVGPAEARVDAAVDRRGADDSGGLGLDAAVDGLRVHAAAARGRPDAAVDGARRHVGAERLGPDGAVDGPPDEADVLGQDDLERHLHVAVADVAAQPLAGRARAALAGVLRADDDAVRDLIHDDLDLALTPALGLLDGLDADAVAGARAGADRAVDAVD